MDREYGTVIKTLLMHEIQVMWRVFTLRRSACYYLKLLENINKVMPELIIVCFVSFLLCILSLDTCIEK